MTTPHDDPSRAAARVAWLQKIDGCLQRGDYARAQVLLAEAERLLPGDAELAKRQQVITIASRFDDGATDRTLVRPQRRAGMPVTPSDSGATQIVPGRRPAPPASIPAPMPPPSEAPTVVMSRPVLPSVPALQPVDSNPLLSDDLPVAAAPPAPARPPTPAPPPASRTRPARARSPWIVPAAATIGVVLAGTAAVFMLSSAETPPTRRAEPLPVAPAPAPSPAPLVAPPPLPPPVEPVPPPADTTQPVSTPQPRRGGIPTAPVAARLALQGLPPRTTVVLDGRSIGSVSADGSFTHAGIAAGTHTIRLERPGHQPVTLARDFSAGGAVHLAAADVVFTALPATVQIQADPDVEMTITRDGRLVQQVKGASQFSLDAGTYRIEAMGSARVPLERPLTLAVNPGESRTLEVRAVTGMDKFPPAGWTVRDGWHTRRGGGIVLYDLRTTDGRAVFSVRLSGTNLFSGGRRLGWIVAYRDDLNYMRCELDRRNYYRIDIVNGTPTEVVIPHQIPLNGSVVHIGITIAGSRLVQQYRAADGQWQTFDSWTRESSGLTGRFGFFVPGNLELAISNFLFYPPAR